MNPPTRQLDQWFDIDHRTGDRRIGVIGDGRNRLACLLHLIVTARHRIDVISYHFSADTAGTQILGALVRACERGVAVRVNIDSFGSNTTDDSFLAALRDAGGAVQYFSRAWRSSYLVRNHQKLILIDGDLAMLGGFNLADSYLRGADRDSWRDLGFVVIDPSTARLDLWFEALWTYTRDDDGRWFRLRRIVADWHPGHGSLQWHLGGPTRLLSPWVLAMRRDIVCGKRLDIVMAYFSPGRWLLRKIGRLAQRGPLRLVLAGRSDNGTTIAASRSLYGSLLRRGAQIWEYQPQRLHTKLIVIDDTVYFGSSNFDARSLFLNVEIMARVEDAAFAEKMRALVSGMIADSVEITPAAYLQLRGWSGWLRWTLAWFVVGVVDYTVTRRINFGLNQPEPYAGQDDDDETATSSG